MEQEQEQEQKQTGGNSRHLYIKIRKHFQRRAEDWQHEAIDDLDLTLQNLTMTQVF